jgi:thioredoxin 1
MMMLAQGCSCGKANFWVLMACVVSAWLVFSWIPSVWRSKGDVMSKIIKIVVVIGLVACVAVVLAVKQGRSTPSGDTSIQASPSNLPRLVDLGSTTCIPCKMMTPILEELKKDYAGRLEVMFVDVGKNPDRGTPYNIQLIPTQIFFDPNGQELFRHEGFFSKEDILAKWKELGISLAAAASTPPEPAKVEDRTKD